MKYFIQTFGCPTKSYLSPFWYYSYTAQDAILGGQVDLIDFSNL